MTHEKPVKFITIYMAHKAVIDFKGWYRRDMEKTNWHYYEDVNGTMYHCRKEHMLCVVESSESDAKEAKKL